MGNGIIWNPDPLIALIGPLQLRYYGILFAATVLIGFYLTRRQWRIYGFPDKIVDDFLLWVVVGLVVGARLVHCLFYEPEYYLSHPLEILKVYKGGVASHGATIGIIAVVGIFVKRYKMKFFELGDGVVFAAAVGATLVRVGNLFNSEIVGRITTVPWGFKFLRFPDDLALARNAASGLCDISKMDCLIQYWPVRHPSQIYEALGGLTILVIMLTVSDILKRKKLHFPGIFTGIFMVLYFSFRFFIEFVKEYQTLEEGLTMGQYLSIPFVLFGIFTFVYIYKKRPQLTVFPAETTSALEQKNGKKRNKYK